MNLVVSDKPEHFHITYFPIKLINILQITKAPTSSQPNVYTQMYVIQIIAASETNMSLCSCIDLYFIIIKSN